MRTMIDIFKKGNQELFHSTMIAWLMDSQAEHQLGRQFMEALADKLEERNDSDLKEAISGKDYKVSTETKGRKSRYDIEVLPEGKHAILPSGKKRIVFENKTKSLGGKVQLDNYGEKVKVIPLGFSEYSFAESVRSSDEYVTLNYSDIYSILDELKCPDDDYGVLVKHYKDFLARDLKLLHLVKEVYAEEQIGRHHELNEIINAVKGYTDNDIRFINYYFFELFKDVALAGANYTGTAWSSSKSMQSGVWLANHGEKPEEFNFSEEIQALCEEHDAKFWLQIDLWRGVSGESLDSPVGMIQLRANCKKDNKIFAKAFQNLKLHKDNQRYPKGIKQSANTFFCICEELKKQDLPFPVLKGKIEDFVNQFS